MSQGPHNSSVPSDPATLLKTCKFIYSYQISHILFESEIGKACHFQLSITANHVTAASAPGSWSLLDQLPPSSSPASASFSSNSMISSETPVAVAEELLFSLDSSTEYLSWVGCFQDVLFKTPEPSSSPSSSKRLYASPARINSTISSTPPAHHQQHVQHQQQHPHHSSSKKAFKSFIKQPSSSASASSAIDQHIQEYERFETIHYKESRKLSLPRAKSTTMTANLKSSKNLKFLSTSMIQFPFDKTTKPKTVTTTDTPPPPPITTSSATTHRKSISLDFRRGDDQGRDVMTSTDTNTITTTPSASRRKSLDIRRLFSNPLTSSKQQQQHQQSEGQEILEGQPMVKIIDTLPPLFIPPVKPSERINTTISSASSSPSRGDGVGDVPPLMKEEEAYSLSRVHQKQKQLQHLKTGSGSNVNSVSEFVGKSKKWIASLNAKLMSGGSGGVSSGTAARSTELVSEDIIIKSNSGDAEPSEPSTKQENDEGMDVSPPRTSNFQLQKQQRQQQQHLYDLSTTSSYRSMPTYSLGGSVNGLKFLNKNPAATSTSSTATIPSSYQMQQPQYQRRPISTAPATTASSFTQHVFGGEADEFYRQLFSAQQQQLEHEHQHQHQQQQHDDDGHGDDLSFEVGDEEACKWMRR